MTTTRDPLTVSERRDLQRIATHQALGNTHAAALGLAAMMRAARTAAALGAMSTFMYERGLDAHIHVEHGVHMANNPGAH